MSGAVEELEAAEPLPSRWDILRPIPQQLAYVRSPHLYNVVPAGRRSGKTERAKRKIVRRAISLEGVTHEQAARFFAGAPTRDQAKHIFWGDLKALTKPWWGAAPRETDLVITLVNGSEIVVVGMDVPARVEGVPWDGGVLDEYANMKPKAWSENVYPALSDRHGWCDLIGVPEGRNHYFDLYTRALAEMLERGAASEWGAFTWHSAALLPPARIEAARRDLDPLTFEQEYEASFVTFSGRAYYQFAEGNKRKVRQLYDPMQPLIICLDFNVAPGVAVVAQERLLPTGMIGTAVIGEVWIENNSSTVAICRKLLLDWVPLQIGRVEVYGDATGGARGTAQTEGSDWDLVKKILRGGEHELAGFGTKVHYFVKDANPAERARVNAINSRCCSSDGTIRLLVDPTTAPHLVKDLEGVALLKGGSGEIDKKKDRQLTHPSDALGYYVEYRFPVTEHARWGSSDFKV